MRKILKALAILIIVVLVIWGGLNVFKYVLYSEYYKAKDNICINPGLNDGFVCQGICADEENGKYYVSGYMKDGSASRIYVTDIENNSYYVSLSSQGKIATYHCGGIAVSKDTVYIASDSALFTVSSEVLLGAENGEVIDIGEGIAVNNEASFVFADEEYIYVGEFTGAGSYATNHPYETPSGIQNAIISKYSVNDLETPERVYSIRDKVQGMCKTDDGRIVLSTSYGIADSYFYIYDENKAIDSGLMLDGAPVYYLSECTNEIKAPAMAEDLDFSEGKVVTLFESACDKYIFGKFFFADKIVSLDI